MSNGIPNIVVYNPAPISITSLNPNSPDGKRLLELYKIIKVILLGLLQKMMH